MSRKKRRNKSNKGDAQNSQQAESPVPAQELTSQPQQELPLQPQRKKLQCFPFLRLPYEIQSIIVACAIDNGRRHHAQSLSYRRYDSEREEVGNVLCVSSRFYELGIPKLYQEVEFCDWEVSQSLVDTLRASVGSGYIKYVQRLVLSLSQEEDIADGAELANTIIQAKHKGLVHQQSFPCLYIWSRADWVHRVAQILRVVKPRKLVWTGVEGVRDVSTLEDFDWEGQNYASAKFAKTVTNSFEKDGWLSHLVSLELDSFVLDEASARCLARLPNLTSLVLKDIDHPPYSSWHPDVDQDRVGTLLIAGGLHTKLSSITMSGLTAQHRQFIQQQIGICVYVSNELPWASAHGGRGAQKGIWHGCRVLHHSGLLLSTCKTCPRCCVLGNRQEYLANLVIKPGTRCFHQPILGMPCKPEPVKIAMVESPVDLPFRYGLCDEHHQEVFGYGVPKDEEAFLHRRALECLRWAPQEEDWIDDRFAGMLPKCPSEWYT